MTRLGRIGIAALAAAGAVSPAVAQDVTPTAPSEPVPLFEAACVNGAVRLSRSIAEPATYGGLPTTARRALGATMVASRSEAEKLPVPAAAAVPNTIYRIGGGQLYLLVPSAAASGTPIGESCLVLWYALSDDDYPAARKLVLPNEERVPLSERPTASAVGASVATSARAGVRMTTASFGGWVALSASPLPESKAPGAN
jgi:hypothetical protein